MASKFRDYIKEKQLLKNKHTSQLRYLRGEIDAYRDRYVIIEQKLRFIQRKNKINKYDMFYLRLKGKIYRLYKIIDRYWKKLNIKINI
jgi:hypothetical protein